MQVLPFRVLPVAILFFSAASAIPRTAEAATIDSVFLVSKSENKNQVHYALDLDESCAPRGAAPLRAYWRMFEKGPAVREPLLAREERAYGIASQSYQSGTLAVVLRALPERPISVRTWRGDDGQCHAAARLVIDGTPARLYNVHVALKFLGVDYLLLTGWADDGRTVREKVGG